MSPRHFARSFRAEVGLTPARYVERVRLEAARRRLEESERARGRGRAPRVASAPPRRCAGCSCARSEWGPLSTAAAFRHLAPGGRMTGPGATTRPRTTATPTEATMEIAILLFDRLTALDAVGPYEVLSRCRGAGHVRRAASRGPSAPTPAGSRCSPKQRSRSSPSRRRAVPGGPGQAALIEGAPCASGCAARTRTHVDRLGLHRLADPRGSRTARGQARHEPLDGARGTGPAGRRGRSASGWCSTGSS